MSFGLEVFNQSGSLGYSSDDVTWNQVDFFVIAGGQLVSNVYPVIDGKEVLVLQMLVNAPPVDRRAIAHTAVISGMTINVSGGSEEAYIMVLMR